MEGLQEEDYYPRKHYYDRRMLRTPDPMSEHVSPTRSQRSLSRGNNHGGQNRSNSKRSILKSTRSQNQFFD